MATKIKHKVRKRLGELEALEKSLPKDQDKLLESTKKFIAITRAELNSIDSTIKSKDTELDDKDEKVLRVRAIRKEIKEEQFAADLKSENSIPNAKFPEYSQQVGANSKRTAISISLRIADLAELEAQVLAKFPNQSDIPQSIQTAIKAANEAAYNLKANRSIKSEKQLLFQTDIMRQYLAWLELKQKIILNPLEEMKARAEKRQALLSNSNPTEPEEKNNEARKRTEAQSEIVAISTAINLFQQTETALKLPSTTLSIGFAMSAVNKAIEIDAKYKAPAAAATPPTAAAAPQPQAQPAPAAKPPVAATSQSPELNQLTAMLAELNTMHERVSSHADRDRDAADLAEDIKSLHNEVELEITLSDISTPTEPGTLTTLKKNLAGLQQREVEVMKKLKQASIPQIPVEPKEKSMQRGQESFENKLQQIDAAIAQIELTHQQVSQSLQRANSGAIADGLRQEIKNLGGTIQQTKEQIANSKIQLRQPHSDEQSLEKILHGIQNVITTLDNTAQRLQIVKVEQEKMVIARNNQISVAIGMIRANNNFNELDHFIHAHENGRYSNYKGLTVAISKAVTAPLTQDEHKLLSDIAKEMRLKIANDIALTAIQRANPNDPNLVKFVTTNENDAYANIEALNALTALITKNESTNPTAVVKVILDNNGIEYLRGIAQYVLNPKAIDQRSAQPTLVINGHGKKSSKTFTSNNATVITAGNLKDDFVLQVDKTKNLEKNLKSKQELPSVSGGRWLNYPENTPINDVVLSPWNKNEVTTFANEITTKGWWNDIDPKLGDSFYLESDPSVRLFYKTASGEIQSYDATRTLQYFNLVKAHPNAPRPETPLFLYAPRVGKVKILGETSLSVVTKSLESLGAHFNIVLATCNTARTVEETKAFEQTHPQEVVKLNFAEAESVPLSAVFNGTQKIGASETVAGLGLRSPTGAPAAAQQNLGQNNQPPLQQNQNPLHQPIQPIPGAPQNNPQPQNNAPPPLPPHNAPPLPPQNPIQQQQNVAPQPQNPPAPADVAAVIQALGTLDQAQLAAIVVAPDQQQFADTVRQQLPSLPLDGVAFDQQTIAAIKNAAAQSIAPNTPNQANSDEYLKNLATFTELPAATLRKFLNAARIELAPQAVFDAQRFNAAMSTGMQTTENEFRSLTRAAAVRSVGLEIAAQNDRAQLQKMIAATASAADFRNSNVSGVTTNLENIPLQNEDREFLKKVASEKRKQISPFVGPALQNWNALQQLLRAQPIAYDPVIAQLTQCIAQVPATEPVLKQKLTELKEALIYSTSDQKAKVDAAIAAINQEVPNALPDVQLPAPTPLRKHPPLSDVQQGHLQTLQDTLNPHQPGGSLQPIHNAIQSINLSPDHPLTAPINSLKNSLTTWASTQAPDPVEVARIDKQVADARDRIATYILTPVEQNRLKTLNASLTNAQAQLPPDLTQLKNQISDLDTIPRTHVLRAPLERLHRVLNDQASTQDQRTAAINLALEHTNSHLTYQEPQPQVAMPLGATNLETDQILLLRNIQRTLYDDMRINHATRPLVDKTNIKHMLELVTPLLPNGMHALENNHPLLNRPDVNVVTADLTRLNAVLTRLDAMQPNDPAWQTEVAKLKEFEPHLRSVFEAPDFRHAPLDDTELSAINKKFTQLNKAFEKVSFSYFQRESTVRENIQKLSDTIFNILQDPPAGLSKEHELREDLLILFRTIHNNQNQGLGGMPPNIPKALNKTAIESAFKTAKLATTHLQKEVEQLVAGTNINNYFRLAQVLKAEAEIAVGSASLQDQEKLKQIANQCALMLNTLDLADIRLREKLNNANAQEKIAIDEKIKVLNEARINLSEAMWNKPQAWQEKKVNYFGDECRILKNPTDAEIKAQVNAFGRNAANPQNQDNGIVESNQGNPRTGIKKSDAFAGNDVRVEAMKVHHQGGGTSEFVTVLGSQKGVYQQRLFHSDLDDVSAAQLAKIAARTVLSFQAKLSDKSQQMNLKGNMDPRLAEAIVAYCQVAKLPTPTIASHIKAGMNLPIESNYRQNLADAIYEDRKEIFGTEAEAGGWTKKYIDNIKASVKTTPEYKPRGLGNH